MRILYLEDEPRDAELVQASLEAEGIVCDVARAETQPGFVAFLQQGGFDLILADYTLPLFDGISALKIAQEVRPEVPFIFVSGTLVEEMAIEALKMGATDYVFKTRLSRIGPSVRRALREAEERVERKKAEKALRQSEASLREQAKLLSLTHDAIFVRDMKGTIKYWNRGAEELYGWTVDEAVGKVAHELLKTVFPVPFNQIEEALMGTGRWEGELVHTKKSGTQLTVASRWSLERGDKGAPIAILVTNNDISERKVAEEERERLRELEADLAHVNRVSMLGELAASLAHELRQPLAATINNANACVHWLVRDEPDLQEARTAAMRIVRDANRAAEVISRLRSLYKQGAPAERELVDVNEVLREMPALLRSEANRYRISIRTDLAAARPKVKADRVQLQQVLLNLMLNGIEAMKDTAGELKIKSELDQDGHLLISVSDTGVGLPAENAEEIFNAFFTTKPQGSGMGLTISRSIVESHGGRLWATSNSSRGATFHFTLPSAGEQVPVRATGM